MVLSQSDSRGASRRDPCWWRTSNAPVWVGRDKGFETRAAQRWTLVKATSTLSFLPGCGGLQSKVVSGKCQGWSREWGQQTNTARWDGLPGSRHVRASRPKHGPVKRARNQARHGSTAPCIQEVSRPSPSVHRHPRPRNLRCRCPPPPPHPKSLHPHLLRSQNHTLGLARCTTEPLRE